MPMLTYQRWKAGKVESGESRQTIRARRRRPVKVGDALYHYANARTPAMCRLRADQNDVCVETFAVVIRRADSYCDVFLRGSEEPAAPDEVEDLARRDGFESAAEMTDWLLSAYGPVMFEGDVIRW